MSDHDQAAARAAVALNRLEDAEREEGPDAPAAREARVDALQAVAEALLAGAGERDIRTARLAQRHGADSRPGPRDGARPADRRNSQAPNAVACGIADDRARAC
ncbi:hypothetical protein ACZ90_68440 [Streptomyces albus subsp. albus]|nr:hypothetical protein ACZ90_68440 [Streptomyces albus subsp. albus]